LFAILFLKGVHSEMLHIWKAYLTLEIVQDKCPKYNGSSISLCPTHYCIQNILCQHLLLIYICSTFLFLTSCDHTMLRSAWGAKACVISTLEDSNRDWNWTCFLQSKNVNHNKQDLLTHKIRKKGPCRAKHSMIAACQEEESWTNVY
jgi:hypothetical protein